MAECLARAAEESRPATAWKKVVKTYLSLEHCDHPESGCPLAALAPELARTEDGMKGRLLAALTNYRDRMIPFMPGRRLTDKERNFLVIFSSMVGAISIARMLPDRAARAAVLGSAENFLLHSFGADKPARQG
jgi:TetR/AcrR family transcriptional repressor of nem operon